MTAADADQTLRLFETALDGSGLVEASAGTGKTYTITALFVRLVAEGVQTVDRILVVTYTRAATAELRDRIRRALAATVGGLRNGSHGSDDFSRELIAAGLDREAGLCRLENAVLGFDLAPVYTIHGFCQRALADNAFESGSAFDTEMTADESDFLVEVVQDFYRRSFYSASPGFIAHTSGIGPAELLTWVRSHLAKPYLELRLPPELPDHDRREAAFARCLDAVRATWVAGGEAVTDLLLNSSALNRNKYRKGSIPHWITALEAYLGAPSPGTKLPEKFEKFTTPEIAESLKKGAEAPRHTFFDDCEALAEAAGRLSQAYDVRLARLRAELIEYTNAELPRRKRNARIQAFDDLLLDLSEALSGPGGAALASTLRRRYGAALIDEFQDTDPVQYDIIRKIWRDSGQSVFFVGDPKQAIYSFRGADVFAYLQGRSDAGRIFALKENWRSVPGLIDATNALFGAVPDPFVFPEIAYPHAEPAQTNRDELVDPDGAGPPFRFRVLGDREDGKPWNRDQGREMAAGATATEIARLVAAGARGEARLGARALGGGDIAVLVRSHGEAKRMHEALARVGVPAVEQSREPVFRSQEAVDLERVLRAIAEPSREDRVAAALTTALFGLSGDDLYALREDARAWQARLASFHDWRQRWRQSGFSRMMYHLMRKETVAQRLMGRPDGPRALTNLRHLVELLHVEARRRRGIEDLLRWFSESRTTDGSGGEEAQIRLESDGDLVKIVTVHKSKGLQYPVVFCPFIWNGALRNSPDETAFHDPSREYRACLDLGVDQEQARQSVEREEMAENLRLLYVALTRAEHRCYVVWGRILGADTSPLGWLLHPLEPGQTGGISTALQARFKTLSGSDLWLRLQRLAAGCPGAFHIGPIEARAEGRADRPVAVTPSGLSARRLDRELGAPGLVTSFSSLTAGLDAEVPDYDAASRPEPEANRGEGAHSIFDFPRGARAGVCLHRIFEQIDFTSADSAETTGLVERTLIEYGFESSWTPVIEGMIRRVLRAPLDGTGSVTLGEVTRQQRLDELEFHYPVPSLDAAALVRLARGRTVPGETVPAGDPSRFMKGFIDLVFEHDGRYFVVDYKSNWLGDSPGAYGYEQLAAAIRGHDYDLQYLIYTVAVHRLLGSRLPDYDYRTRFGGVAYLFLRGIDPDTGPDTGVFRDRPDPELVATLDRYLGACPGRPPC